MARFEGVPVAGTIGGPRFGGRPRSLTKPDRSIRASDYAKLLGAGAGSLAQGLAYGANLATGGISDEIAEQALGRNLTDIGGDVAARYRESVSPRMKEALEKKFIEDGGIGPALTDPHSIAAVAVESLPSMLPGVGVGGLAAKTAARAALARGASKEVARKAGQKAAMVGGGVAEGVVAGGQAGAEVHNRVRQLPEEALLEHPDYRAKLAAGLSHADAREATAKEAGAQAFTTTAPITGALGAWFNRYLGDLVAAGTPSGRLAAAGRGAAVETPTEAAQSASEAFLGNLALQMQANPDQSLAEGVANATVGGAVAGGALGGGVGLALGGGPGAITEAEQESRRRAAEQVGVRAGVPGAGGATPDEAAAAAGIAATRAGGRQGSRQLTPPSADYYVTPEGTPIPAGQFRTEPGASTNLAFEQQAPGGPQVGGPMKRAVGRLAAAGLVPGTIDYEPVKPGELAAERLSTSPGAAPAREGIPFTGGPAPLEAKVETPSEAHRRVKRETSIKAREHRMAAVKLPPDYKEPRLKREEFREPLSKMPEQLTPGGGITLYGGQFDPDNDRRRAGAETPVQRTPSANPVWFQSMGKDPELQGISAKQVEIAVKKALQGRRLGARQQRIITGMLDALQAMEFGQILDATDVKAEEVAAAKRRRDIARAMRRDPFHLPVEAYEGIDDPDFGDRYPDESYDADWTTESRYLYDLMESAAAVDEEAAKRIMEHAARLDSSEGDAEAARKLLEVIRDGQAEARDRKRRPSAEEDGGQEGEPEAERPVERPPAGEPEQEPPRVLTPTPPSAAPPAAAEAPAPRTEAAPGKAPTGDLVAQAGGEELSPVDSATLGEPKADDEFKGLRPGDRVWHIASRVATPGEVIELARRFNADMNQTVPQVTVQYEDGRTETINPALLTKKSPEEPRPAGAMSIKDWNSEIQSVIARMEQANVKKEFVDTMRSHLGRPDKREKRARDAEQGTFRGAGGKLEPEQEVTGDERETGELDTTGGRPLAPPPAETIPAPEGVGATPGGPEAGGAPDRTGDSGLRRPGVRPPASVGTGKGALPVPEGGARDDAGERPGRPATTRPDAGGATGVSGGDVSAEPPRPAVPRGKPAGNYTITDADQLGTGGAKTKFKTNVAAIRLLKELQREKRKPTAEEQAVLVRYVGWGGLPQAFYPENNRTPAKGWEREAAELEELLTEDEYRAARRSTQDAHYTSVPVVRAMYAALDRLGFHGGRVLEPSMGTGNFLGLMPRQMKGATTITGVELDAITGGIAKALYPTADVQAPMGFQSVDVPRRYFDVAIGNPPFGSQTLFDPLHKELSRFSIHNFFFGKSVESVRPGGVVAMVVSHFLMDKAGGAQRAHFAGKTRLLGAIRLPNTAFKATAGTEVTTDIIFLQRLTDEEIEAGDTGESWAEVQTIPDPDGGDPIPLNEYFVRHPEMMLGRMDRTGAMRAENKPTLAPDTSTPLEEQLAGAVARLPEKVYTDPVTRLDEITVSDVAPPEGTKVFGFFVAEDGAIHRRLPDKLGKEQSEPVTDLGATAVKRITAAVRVKDAVWRVIGLEMDPDTTDAELDAARADLNRVYDDAVRRNGFFHEEGNRRLLRDEPEYPILLSLENRYKKKVTRAVAKRTGMKERPATAEKAAIFTQRVVPTVTRTLSAETAEDALTVSLNEAGRVDMERMAELTGKSRAELVMELHGVIFNDPDAGWVPADEYLSGNVKGKLANARAAGPEFRDNVAALERVQPSDIDPFDIRVRPSSPWIPFQHMRQFADEVCGCSLTGDYLPGIGRWNVDASETTDRTRARQWGTSRVSAGDLLERLMMNKEIAVYDRDDDGKRHINKEATVEANAKADEIREEFSAWVWKDPDRRHELHRRYNDTYNTHRERQYDGRHLSFPGKVPDAVISFRPHQRDAIWRLITDGFGLLDHVVGAGKTFTLVGAVMEMKRMGLVRKPMLVVPNHLVEQWASDFMRLYPGARILAAGTRDFQKDRRRQLFARIATGEWDAVIVAHSSFGFIEVPAAEEAAFLQEQLRDLEAAIQQMEQMNASKRDIKAQEKAKERLEEKIKKAMDRMGEDDVVDFNQLGVDTLMVDEAHEFKNLWFTTARRVAGAGNPKGSQKAMGLFMKGRILQRRQGGRGLFFATGTPVSNSLSEMFTMMRYMTYDILAERGLTHFDPWSDTFANASTEYELDATGARYKQKTRFRSFVNVAELMQLYRAFADVVSLTMLKEQAAAEGKQWPTPNLKGGKPTNVVVPRSEQQAAYMEDIIARAESMPSDPREDNFLKLTNDARLAGLDMRLIDDNLPDHPESKVNRCCDEVHRIYSAWRDRRGTQLVFIDLSTPKASRAKEAKEIRDLLEKAEQGDEEAATKVAQLTPDDLLAVQAKFSVYDDLKAKLVGKGIPESEIVFIHSANTDKQKEDLFDRVRGGDVCILLGSTKKMGAGMNVQNKLVALHHLDAPWRPSDLEQREGRIIRQGNEFYEQAVANGDPDAFEIEILRYSTEQTYDARMWQVLETKARLVQQLRSAGFDSREVEDVDGQAANAAEMKAAASGNPLILEQVELASDVQKLRALARAHDRKKFDAESRLRGLQEGGGPLARMEAHTAEFDALIARRDANTGDQFSATVDGDSHDSRKTAGAVLQVKMAKMLVENAKKLAGAEPEVDVGTYRGFNVHLSAGGWTPLAIELTSDDGEVYVTSYANNEEISGEGAFTRMDNKLKALEAQKEKKKRFYAEQEKELADLRVMVAEFGEFKGEEELTQKQTRLREVERQLASGDRLVEEAPSRAAAEAPRAPVRRPTKRSTLEEGLGVISDPRFDETPQSVSGEPAHQAGPSFSFAPGAAGRRGISVAAVRKAVRGALARISSDLGVTVNVVETTDDLPDFIIKAAQGRPVEAAHHQNQIWLVAGNISSRARARAVLAHEVIGHAAVDQIVGEDWDYVRRLIADAVENNAEAADIMEEVRHRYPNARGARVVREFIAVAAERRVREGPIARILAMIRRAVRQFLASLGLQAQRSMADIDSLISAAGRYARQGGEAARSGVETPSGPAAAPTADAAFSEGDTFADDMARQAMWMEQQAKAAGFADVQDMVMNDPLKFAELAERWRSEHVRADVDYSLGSVGKPPGGGFKARVEAAQRAVGQFFTTHKKVNWWHRSIGTMYDLAQRVPEFRPVFEAGQRYLSDVSLMAVEAENLAPQLFRKMGTMKETLSTGSAKAADVKAAEGAIYEGTWTDNKVYTDDELRQKFGLTDPQIRLYRQAIAATHKSLDDITKAFMHRIMSTMGIDRRSLDILRDQAENAETFLQDAYTSVLRPLIDHHKQNVRLLEQALAAVQPRTPQEAEIEAHLEAARGQLKQARDAVGELFSTRQRMRNLKEDGYFPLMRFGRYSVDVTTMDGDGNLVREFFGTFETEAEANRMADAMREEYGPGYTVEQGVMSNEDWRMYPGLSPDSIEAFAKASGADSSDLFQAYLRLAVSNRSALKRLIKRKKIPGYSPDLRRTLATFILANARLASTYYHMPDMMEATARIPKRMGDVKDQAVRLVEYLTRPTEEFAALRGYLFFHFIGGSVASAMVNLTQVPMATYPYLSQFDAKGALSAVRKWFLSPGRVPDTVAHREALKRAEEEGIVSPQEVYNLMATARGGTLGPGRITGTQSFQTAMHLWGFMFSMAEQFNRRVTFNAAYEMAVEMGRPDPYDFAIQAVHETQFIYNRGNRPNWARGIGAPIFTFKQFSISYLELLSRLPNRERGLAIALIVLAAGVEGLPFEEDLEDIIDTIVQWTGTPWSTRVELEDFVIDVLGEELGLVALRGVTGLGIPLDVQGRLSFANLLPGTSVLKPSAVSKGREVAEVFGAAGSVVQGIGQGLEHAFQGEPSRAVRAVMPKTVKDAWQGIEIMQTGEYRDPRGRRILEAGPTEAGLKAIGFYPTKVSDARRRQFEVATYITLHKKREQAIADKWARGIAYGRPRLVTEALRELEKWNAAHPELAIRIQQHQILRRVRALQMDERERFERRTPREIRAEVQARI